MNSRDYIDIVINQTSFNESLDISVDNIFIDGKPVEKIKPSVSDYLTDEEKQSIVDNLLLASNNTEFTYRPKVNDYFYGKREALILTKKQLNTET